jgi:hypothetical protein
MRIGSKVKLSLFVVAVGITICATLASHSVSRRVLIEALSDHLGTTARSRANHIETLLEGYKSRIALVAKDHRIQACLRAAAKQGREEGPAGQELNGVLREFTDETREFLSVLVLDRQGTVVGSSDQRSGAMDMSDSQCFLQGSHALYVEDAFRDEGAGVGVLAIAAPVTEQEKLLGVVVARIAMNGLNKITSARTGLGKTGEIYVVNRDGYMVTRSRFVKDSFLKQTVDTEITREHFAEVDASSEEAHLYTAATYPSYMGRRVFGLHAHINAMPWCLCAEISEKEALGPLAAIRTLALVILCGASLVAWAIGSMVSRFLTGPIEELQRGVQELGRGHLECRVGTVAADEIGDL